MNNIEILIENFEQLKKNKFIIESIDPEFFFKFGENLLKKNTELRIQISARETVVNELEKENKELKEKREEYEKQLDLDYVEENYIPKSKVKAKIEEIKRNDYSSYDTCLCLQELLEKGEIDYANKNKV